MAERDDRWREVHEGYANLLQEQHLAMVNHQPYVAPVSALGIEQIFFAPVPFPESPRVVFCVPALETVPDGAMAVQGGGHVTMDVSAFGTRLRFSSAVARPGFVVAPPWLYRGRNPVACGHFAVKHGFGPDFVSC